MRPERGIFCTTVQTGASMQSPLNLLLDAQDWLDRQFSTARNSSLAETTAELEVGKIGEAVGDWA